MDVLWPGFLILMGIIPLLLAAYLWMLRRKKRYTVRYSSLSLVREALPRSSRLRRHLPFALFLAALACLIFAAGRPVSVISLPSNQTTIVLAMDVSRSMLTPDIRPNRMLAAQEAAIAFVERQKSGTQIALVAFSGFAELVQQATLDQEVLREAILSLTNGSRTAVGSAILKSIDAIAEVDPNVVPSVSGSNSSSQVTPVPNGAYVPEIIVLLTDGASNTGPLPLDAAKQAVERGIRIYTIGYGTENGILSFDRQPPGGSQQFGGGGGGGGGGFRTAIDEPTLKKIAAMTGGEYYAATSASEIHSVFQNLPTHLITRTEIMEISFIFAAVGALLAAAAIGLALWWNPMS